MTSIQQRGIDDQELEEKKIEIDKSARKLLVSRARAGGMALTLLEPTKIYTVEWWSKHRPNVYLEFTALSE